MNGLGRNDPVIVQDEDDVFLVISSTHPQVVDQQGQRPAKRQPVRLFATSACILCVPCRSRSGYGRRTKRPGWQGRCLVLRFLGAHTVHMPDARRPGESVVSELRHWIPPVRVCGAVLPNLVLPTVVDPTSCPCWVTLLQT
jgi:hypothetical protein